MAQAQKHSKGNRKGYLPRVDTRDFYALVGLAADTQQEALRVMHTAAMSHLCCATCHNKFAPDAVWGHGPVVARRADTNQPVVRRPVPRMYVVDARQTTDAQELVEAFARVNALEVFLYNLATGGNGKGAKGILSLIDRLVDSLVDLLPKKATPDPKKIFGSVKFPMERAITKYYSETSQPVEEDLFALIATCLEEGLADYVSRLGDERAAASTRKKVLARVKKEIDSAFISVTLFEALDALEASLAESRILLSGYQTQLPTAFVCVHCVQKMAPAKVAERLLTEALSDLPKAEAKAKAKELVAAGNVDEKIWAEAQKLADNPSEWGLQPASRFFEKEIERARKVFFQRKRNRRQLVSSSDLAAQLDQLQKKGVGNVVPIHRKVANG